MARALILALVVLAACGGPAAVVTPTPSASAAATSSPMPAATPSPSPSSTLGLMPIFDAHLHYSRESWTAYPPEKIAAVMDLVGVRSELVSSAAVAGSFRLNVVMCYRIVDVIE